MINPGDIVKVIRGNFPRQLGKIGVVLNVTDCKYAPWQGFLYETLMHDDGNIMYFLERHLKECI